MRIAYLITVYDNPKHLQRLIRVLSSPSCAFFVHVDRKSNSSIFSNVNGKNVCFPQEKITVYWGDFSMIEAVLVLLRTAFADHRHFDRFVLLSGTDFPLQPAKYIENFFKHNSGAEFMNKVRMPSEAAGKPISRLTTYRIRPGKNRTLNGIRRILTKVYSIIKKRDYQFYLRDLIPYGGTTWWAITRNACEYILEFINKESQIIKFFKNVYIPEESFFQTILGNSPFKSNILRNLTYADWSAGGRNPALLTEKHIEFFKSNPSITIKDVYGAGELLFARKFSDKTQNLTKQLERLIREKEDQLTT